MLMPGITLGGRYRLDERIASGGMGDVWRADDVVLGRTVAVKVLQPAMLAEPGFAERFQAEARVMATLNHPGVVRIYDYGENAAPGGGQLAYLVMEYVEGEPLSRVLQQAGRLTPSRAMDLVAQAADALQAAHDHGVVHRDVKPGNLLVRPQGRLVLTDFGIARSAMSGALTQAGSILGTASYVSPEQATGTKVTYASDVYSLGVVAYQCLAGHRPFEGDNPIEVAMRHINEPPPALPADVPPAVRELVGVAMAKDPAHRWPTASAMATAARRAARGEQVADPRLGSNTSTHLLAAGATAPTSPATGGTGPVSPAGYSPGIAAMRGGAADQTYQYGGGNGAGDKDGKRSGGLTAALVAGALLVVFALGGIGYVLLSSHDRDRGSDNPSKTSSNSPVNAEIVLSEADYLGKDYAEVAKKLTGMGLHPSRLTFHQDGYKTGQVTSISPTTVHKGDSVEVGVQPDWDEPPTMPTISPSKPSASPSPSPSASVTTSDTPTPSTSTSTEPETGTGAGRRHSNEGLTR